MIVAVTTIAQWRYVMTFMPMWMGFVLLLALAAQASDVATTILGRSQGLTEENPVPGLVSWPVEYGLKAAIWIAVAMTYINTGPSIGFVSLLMLALGAGAYATWNNARLLK